LLSRVYSFSLPTVEVSVLLGHDAASPGKSVL